MLGKVQDYDPKLRGIWKERWRSWYEKHRVFIIDLTCLKLQSCLLARYEQSLSFDQSIGDAMGSQEGRVAAWMQAKEDSSIQESTKYVRQLSAENTLNHLVYSRSFYSTNGEQESQLRKEF